RKHKQKKKPKTNTNKSDYMATHTQSLLDIPRAKSTGRVCKNQKKDKEKHQTKKKPDKHQI
ncbi:hypothetical protein LXA62_18185, partial [Erwinia amylovora]|uniref:hypothetical protein n=1 Tax=Erwinia amylovora TaxID=552 RepID=UPI0020C03D41